MNDKRWNVVAKVTDDSPSGIFTLLLKNRGIAKKDQKTFIDPPHPTTLSAVDVGIDEKSLAKAKKRLAKAIKHKEHVVVFGDYDADGVTGTAILWEAFYENGVTALPYIPDRVSQGYGLSKAALDDLLSSDPTVSLIFTVDNGIVASDAIAYAHEKGIDVVVTDHHTKQKKVPEAFAILHTTSLCGASVAWIVAKELFPSYTPSLELAAIGTIADQVPLVGFNRSFALHGLAALRTTKRIGLLSLFEASQIEKGTIDTYSVSFGIAPRINAAGRIHHAMDALRLLCTKDLKRSSEIAASLQSTNTTRQEVVDTVLKDIEGKLTKADFVIALYSETYHEGVVGLAAGKLTERFYRPSIVGTVSEGVVKASARSIPEFNIIEAILSAEVPLLGAGGHPMAAGFSIKESDFPLLIDAIRAQITARYTADDLVPSITIDCELPLSALTYPLYQYTEKLEPTGTGNPKALFVTKGVTIQKLSPMGNGKHVRFVAVENGVSLPAVAFGWGEHLGELQNAQSIDVAYYFEKNVWNGNENLQIRVKDIKIHHGS